MIDKLIILVFALVTLVLALTTLIAWIKAPTYGPRSRQFRSLPRWLNLNPSFTLSLNEKKGVMAKPKRSKKGVVKIPP
jgi:hypothetical protein